MSHEFQDLNNFESDPEEFARTFCKDLGIDDPEVGVSIKFKLLTYKKCLWNCHVTLLWNKDSSYLITPVGPFKASDGLVLTSVLVRKLLILFRRDDFLNSFFSIRMFCHIVDNIFSYFFKLTCFMFQFKKTNQTRIPYYP